MNLKNKLIILVILAVSSLFISSFAHAGMAFAVQPEDQWVAHPLNVSYFVGSQTPIGYTPSQIRAAYNLPSSGGLGATIAIIDAYYTPSVKSDLAIFSSQFGLPAPTDSNFEVHPMTLSNETDNGWGVETCLDVEWAHAIAPDAKILLVEASTSDFNDLFSAVNYAKNRPDVVAISMSWGDSEHPWQVNYDSRFISSYGAVFFAASGDNGSNEIFWPATSPNVVAVGGTKLTLDINGTVISETGWTNSGGGISAYENRPAYQTSYGLTSSKRTIPDISYNADPYTGVAVYYNSLWFKVGGTSAGPPQWAAIQALGKSATNTNLYQKAKYDYASYFRDITDGSNGGYSANLNYDYVTGLGSPLTVNFASAISVSPTSGPAGGLLSINGTGFTPGSPVGLAYLNPITANWTTLIDNLTTTSSGEFTYLFNAPDLNQSNVANDSSPSNDSIRFLVLDKVSGYLCSAVVPYSEYRRGLTSVGNMTAVGLFGNNTSLASTVYAQADDPVVVSGRWFNPGTPTFLCDNSINVGSAAVDGTGSFSATITLTSAISAGQHTITLNDGKSNFAFTITRSPNAIAMYDGAWHNSNYNIILSADGTNVNMYYRINGQSTQNVNDNGQPFITSEGSNNDLEYWGVYSVGGSSIELTHKTLNGLQLDKTPPEGSLQINAGATSASSQTVTLSLTATDSASGVKQVRFSSDGVWDTEQWETLASSKSWLLSDGNGVKTVYCQIQDYACLNSTVNSSILLAIVQPTPTASPTTTPPQAPTPSPTPTSTPTPFPTTQPSDNTSTIPEYPASNYMIVLMITTLLAVGIYRKNYLKKQTNH